MASDREADVPPRPNQIPEVTPSSYGRAVNDGWVLEGIMEIQKTLGKLSTQVDRLIMDTGKHGDKIDAVRHQISFVKGALWVMGNTMTIGGGIAVWHLKDKIGGK